MNFPLPHRIEFLDHRISDRKQRLCGFGRQPAAAGLYVEAIAILEAFASVVVERVDAGVAAAFLR